MIMKISAKIIFNVVVVLMLVGGVCMVCSRFIHLGNVEYTDNAQVRQLVTPVNSRVQGFVKEVRFSEYAQVKKGDTLLIIEDAEFRLRLAQAKADFMNATTGKTAMNTTISTTENNIAVTDAGIEEVAIRLKNAETELNRYAELVKRGAATQQQYDRVETDYNATKARYEQLMRQKNSTALIKQEQTVRLGQNDAAIQVAAAQLNLAQLNLSYTVIVAPCDGTTGRKDIQEGQLIQPGQTIVDIVADGEAWIIANYRETQLSNIAVGAEVEIKADAVPDVVYTGHVVAISRATGAAYSVIPQDNATGNFVKVEQRIPVKIMLDDSDKNSLLRAGLNVECEVKY
ncbi:MAG: HlyD family secretion protein [Bacteroidales bacterium]|nr:HlyD family secretion protein [Bacteroidales bacterium]MBR6249934.1 HlyD family secretion protein [Bacteroidales bacterium]